MHVLYSMYRVLLKIINLLNVIQVLICLKYIAIFSNQPKVIETHEKYKTTH
jgi:hypothetical protein